MFLKDVGQPRPSKVERAEGDIMEDSNVEIAVDENAGERIVALKVLKETYSDMLNEYERQIDEVSALGRVNRNTLYNPAVLHEIEAMAYKRKFDELLSAVWIAQSQLMDIIALERTVCVLTRSMNDKELEASEKQERDIDHENLPYEAM